MVRVRLSDGERAQLATGGLVVQKWEGGPHKQPWYDKYGRVFILPVQPDLDKYRRGRGLSLTPPDNPEPYIHTDPAEAFLPKAASVPKAEPMTEVGVAKEELFGGLPYTPPKRRTRGPDKKPRKRRKSKRHKRA